MHTGGDTHSHLPLKHQHSQPGQRQISRCRSRSRNIRKDGTERQAQHGRHFRRKACRRSMVQLHQEEAATRTRKLKVQNADPLRFALSHFHDNLRQ